MAVKEVITPTESYGEVRKSTEEKRDRFPNDQRLRRFGFRIHSRPSNGPAVWERNGHIYEWSEAQRIVTHELKKLESKE
jgi:hypothetical protein